MTKQAITTNLEYYIDDSIPSNQETRLPVTISNIFFKNRKLDYFTTHNSSMSAWNRWSMVDSSTIEHTYEDKGVVERNGMVNADGIEIEAAHDGKWIFDDDYCVDIREKEIPAGARTGYYTGKEKFEPNEQYDEQWLDSLVRDSQGNFNDADLHNNHGALWSQRQDIFVDLQRTYELNADGSNKRPEDNPCVNPGFGLINEYVLTLHNEGGTSKTFSYLFQGNHFNMRWSVNGSAFQEKEIIQATNNTDFIIDGEDVGCEEVFFVELPPGVTTITIQAELLNGSNPTAHNAFAINIPRNTLREVKKTSKEYYTLYPASLHDMVRAMNFSQD